MFRGKRILAVVPARGGSKGIPLKNLRKVGKYSMVGRVGKVLEELPEIDRAVVSTDHDGIAAEAEAHGIMAPFRRPEALSGDRIGDLEVLTQALLATESLDQCQYDWIVMLQPTSPMRRVEHVRACLEDMADHDRESVWSLSETDSKGHPLKQLTVSDQGDMAYYDLAGKKIIARQQLKPVFHRNGICYVIDRECLLGQKSILGNRAGAVVIKEPSVSIDTEEDIIWAEFMMDRTGME